MDELNPDTVDIFISALSQVQGSRSGPIGRVTNLKNGVATHYDVGRVAPHRIKVKQRNGFRSLTTNGHSSSSGAPLNPAWANPELLSSQGDQILSIANAIPRVWDGTDWTNYDTERVVSNILSQSVFHTSQRTINVTDESVKSGVTCSVWVERYGNSSLNTALYVGFKDSDGAWIRTPQLIYDPNAEGDGYFTSARTIADDGADFFWVVYDRLVTGSNKFRALLFDLNGQQINSLDTARNQVTDLQAAWFDIIKIPTGGCYLAQPQHTTQSATDGVTFTSFTQVAGVISSITTDNPDIHCRGKLAWVTNDLTGIHWYLATIGLGENPGGKLWGYQINPPSPDPFGHEYNFAIEIPVDTAVDSLIGFVKTNTNPDNFDGIPDLYVSFTVLRTAATNPGPIFDPQLRFSHVYACDFADNVTDIRQNDYTCQVSRAFLHDNEYYSLNYYQSGSGNTVQSTTLAVDFTAGDYMIGSKLQSVNMARGGSTYGSPKAFDGLNVATTDSQALFSITGTDTVTPVTANLLGRGTVNALKWTFANLSATYPGISGSRLIVSGSSIPSADGTWDILAAAQDGSVYTAISNINGGTVLPGTFTATANSVHIIKMSIYRGFPLTTAWDETTKSFLDGGSMVVSGSGTAVNNGTKTVVREVLGSGLPADPYGLGEGIWITTGSEVTAIGGYHVVLTTLQNDKWFFSDDNHFDDALLNGPHTMIVENSSFNLNGATVTNDSAGNGYNIVSIPTFDSIETDGTSITTEIFYPATPPTITIRVPDDISDGSYLTLFLQDITPDYSYIGALVTITADTFRTENNGVFSVIGFDPDPTHHILYVVPTDGRDNYKTQLFYSDQQAIAIVFGNNVQPEFQPCWLMVPLTGTKPVVGRFEYGLAYADWRYDGLLTPVNLSNVFGGHVTTPCRGDQEWLFILPFRAISFTTGQSIATANGQVVNAAIASSQSTVGTKQFSLKDLTGLATKSSNQLMLPGPMCGEFTASGFNENGVNFGFEAPFLVSQQVSSNDTALRKGGVYQVVAVAEVTDEDSDRIFSIVSPPLNYQLTGNNNSATYGIRMLQPLDSNGIPVAKHFGVTNRKIVGISFYRTSYQNATPTTERHKITIDLNVNGLAPVSDTNDSGFSFPDEFTANYLDENLDAAVINNEIVYTDKGFLPRFPGPANRNGDFWKERTWLVGYDGAIWMSAEKKEGDAVWFFPLFRVVLPTTDKPVAIAEMDDYLIIGCERSMWYLPAANFPDATGRSGTIPRPVQLPFNNGCTGHMVTLRQGVVYSSTDQGVWIITRDLQNKWFSHAIQDTLEDEPITSMTIDKRQRLIVATATHSLVVYDQILEMWYNDWQLPTSAARLLTTLNGETVFQDDNRVWLHDPTLFRDELNGSPSGIPLDVTFSSFNFGKVRSVKALWELQIIGDYKGPHHFNAELSYPDDDPGNPTIFPDPADGPYTPDPTLPYLLAINPMIESASSYGLRIFTDFSGITDPQDSCEIELIACEVGVDGPTGLNKMPDNQRVTGL